MTIIGQSFLSSDTKSSYTLSGGVSTAGKIINGKLDASTSNTYSTTDQDIKNDFFYEKYKNWNVTPKKATIGTSWEIEPCIRILNTNASSYKNQAYTSFQGGYIYPGNGIVANPVKVAAFEVGGAW